MSPATGQQSPLPNQPLWYQDQLLQSPDQLALSPDQLSPGQLLNRQTLSGHHFRSPLGLSISTQYNNSIIQ